MAALTVPHVAEAEGLTLFEEGERVARIDALARQAVGEMWCTTNPPPHQAQPGP